MIQRKIIIVINNINIIYIYYLFIRMFYIICFFFLYLKRDKKFNKFMLEISLVILTIL